MLWECLESIKNRDSVHMGPRKGANLMEAACKHWVALRFMLGHGMVAKESEVGESDEEIESVVECARSNHFYCCVGLGVVSQCDTCTGGRDTD